MYIMKEFFFALVIHLNSQMKFQVQVLADNKLAAKSVLKVNKVRICLKNEARIDLCCDCCGLA